MSDISSTSSTPSGMTGAGGGNMLRITGLATGLDVDSMVKKMLAGDQTKIDQAKQAQQIVQWKQQAYQSIITDVKSLQSSFFDITNPSSYALTQNNYKNITTSSSNTSAGTATAAVGAAMGNYTLSVSQMAQAATISGTNSINSQYSLNATQVWAGKSLTFTDNSNPLNTANISIPANFTGNANALVANINSQIQSSSLNGELTAVNDNGKIKFVNSSSTSSINMSGGGNISDIGSNSINISANGNYETVEAGISAWQNGSINFNVGGSTTPVTLNLSGFQGTTASDLAAYINTQISSNSSYASLNGQVSASVVNNGSGDCIEFTPLTSTQVQISSSNIKDLPSSSTTLTAASSSTSLASLGVTGVITLNLNYNGTNKSITLDNSNSDKNIGDLVSAINSQTNGQVTGSFDDITGKFALQTGSTGSTSSLQITSGSTASLLTALSLSVGSSPTSGKDAIVAITSPGANNPTTLTEGSNNFTLNGVSYSLTGLGTTSISLTSNTTQVHDMIKNFLDKYNSIVDEIQTQLTQKRDYNYPPLTDSQKSSMSATDITSWNNKAQQGLLNNDQNLQDLLTSLRQAFTTPVTDGSGNNLTSIFFGNVGSGSIGIDTSDDYTQGSKITIVDDVKFTQAIAQHGDQIMKLFTNVSNSANQTTNFNQSGIFQRINTILQNNVGIIGSTLTGTLSKYANVQDDFSASGGMGSGNLPDQIYTKQLLINTLTNQMNSDQTKYYNQFTQLETAMNQINAQQSTISSMLSSG